MPKLTKILLDKAELRERQYTIWCSELKGFGAFVMPSGIRTYLSIIATPMMSVVE